MKFSIITVSYNSAATIGETILSVLTQTVSPFEYIIVDGKSSDETCTIAESFRSQFSEKGIHYAIISEPDNGIYDAMNKGIKMSTGDVVGMINSDDTYEPTIIEEMQLLFDIENCDIAYSDLNIVTNAKKYIKKAKIDSKVFTTRHWNHPTMFVKKDVYNEFPYQNKTIYDDWDFYLKARKHGCKIAVINKPLANFTFGGVSNHKSFSSAMKRAKTKTKIYTSNGYSPLYAIEAYSTEIAKLLF
jgi:glycosyltransferase involved in cell wall biosynthesis